MTRRSQKTVRVSGSEGSGCPREGLSSLRSLPSVDRLVAHPILAEVSAWLGLEWIVATARAVVDEARAGLRLGGSGCDVDSLAAGVAARCRQLRFGGLRRVVNATGVLLHTNLGRAVLAPEVVSEAVAEAAGSVSVELDLRTGERGNRYESVQRLLTALTGCESSVVVNNNAAAVLLVLNTFARGREVVLSRGEMIEIGGSFRLPEIIRSSGATLVEVGTTNRTHLADYRKALSPRTGLLMKVHTSNYRVVGFTKAVEARDLLGLAAESGVPVYEDLGSGSLVELGKYGLTPEPTVQQAVVAGLPLVSFSGDKLLGGPQAGLIVGRRALIDELLSNHLLRALRVDKLTLALLERTLATYLDPAGPQRRIPLHGLLARPIEELRRMAVRLVDEARRSRLSLAVRDDSAAVGGGACPTDKLPTVVVEIFDERRTPDELASLLRRGARPVLGRIREDRLCLDMRTVLSEELETLLAALEAADREPPGPR
ncbi:MAG: L-seryl-tRNA(Sec) selenium transferase [Candidatus Riflebacteria bacterium]|nr:L-seryl-tRNA(Sec) selenium transferase [Candidatus Riflebacteria bacterium]